MATDAKFKVGDCAACGGVCMDRLPYYGKRMLPQGTLCESCWQQNGDSVAAWEDRIQRAIDSRTLSPGRVLTEDGSVRVNEEQAEALTFRGIDPASDAEPEFKVECHKFNDAHARKLTDALPANVTARARNIAALSAELSKPVTPRYPAEGRSDRALSVTNGMIRGRE